MMHAEHYRTLYRDAYVAVAQLRAISEIASTDDPDLEKAEKAVFICFENFIANDNTFNYVSQLAKSQKVNYRSITKDSMRCLLIYMTIFMK